MAELAACEDTLSLFTEGIAGRYFHIKATDEFANARRLLFDTARAAQSSDAIYLPEQVDAPDHSCYRVLVMEQLGLRECGTFSFRIADGLAQVPELLARYQEPKGTSSPRPRPTKSVWYSSATSPGVARSADIASIRQATARRLSSLLTGALANRPSVSASGGAARRRPITR